MVRSTLSRPQKYHILEGRAVATLCQGRLGQWSCPRFWINCSWPTEHAVLLWNTHHRHRRWHRQTDGWIERQMDAEKQVDWQSSRWTYLHKIKGDRNTKGKPFVAVPLKWRTGKEQKNETWQQLEYLHSTVLQLQHKISDFQHCKLTVIVLWSIYIL